MTGWRAGEGPLVDFPDNAGGPLLARSTAGLDQESLAAAAGGQVVLLFDQGDPRRPLVVGILDEPSETPCLDLVLEAADEEAPAPGRQEVLLDGKRVVLEGDDEVVLRCGRASITLRRNGKIVIRGTYLISRAEGTNRIKGGSVQIN